MKKYSISFAALLLSCVALAQPGRKETNLSKWQFSHDQLSWQEVTIPHDWAIAGPFDKKHDLQVVAIEQNGETEKSEKSGRSGALPWMGKGYYKKTLHLDSRPEHAELLFDGAMSEPRVIVNGTEAIYWPYGYNAFRADVTALLRQGDNLVEVHLQNLEESSRWYPGAGLYRPVSLIITGKAHIDDWGTYFHTLQADEQTADIDVTTVVEGIADGETLCDGRILLCTFANGEYVGGSFRCAPRASVEDGQLELCMVKPLSKLKFAKMIGLYQRGEHLDSPVMEPYITYRPIRQAEIEAPKDCMICLDGEIRTGNRFTVACAPGALRFIVPAGAAHTGKGIDMAREKAV